MIFIRNLIVLSILVSCTTPVDIKSTDVKRVITILASDDMQGRKPFTEGISKAADFIAQEFKDIGLESFTGSNDYRQTFSVNSISLDASKVVINNQLVSPNDYFMRLAGDTLGWSEDNMPDVKVINDMDNFRDKGGEAFGTDKDLLVLVSLSHKDIFQRYRAYFSRPTLQLEGGQEKKANIVFVLIKDDKVNSLSIEASVKKEKKELYNVVGKIEGKRKDEIVLYSGHYDHLGEGQPVEGDSIYNGANDDASGTTAVIELARYFKSNGTPERTLVFAAFTAEEIGGYGSQYFSKQLDPNKIVAMFNIEMIGKPSKEGLNSAWMTGWDKSDLGEILQKNLAQDNYKFFADPYPDQHLFYRSDNATLARLGVPAHSISTTQIDIDKDYHQASDEVSTLDIENITNTIKAIAVGSQGIVDGTQTPSRINPDDVDD